MNTQPSPSLLARWYRKFSCALRGAAVAAREEDSFAVHVPAAVAVLALGWIDGVTREEWMLLVLCVVVVVAAELFNSALERLASAVTAEVDPRVRDALDMSAGAVLVVAAGAAAVGLVVFFG